MRCGNPEFFRMICANCMATIFAASMPTVASGTDMCDAIQAVPSHYRLAHHHCPNIENVARHDERMHERWTAGVPTASLRPAMIAVALPDDQFVRGTKPGVMPRQTAVRPVGARSFASRSQLHSAIHAAALRHRIDPLLLASLVQAESGFRLDARSPKGALGLTQVLPSTARDLGVADPDLLQSDPMLSLDTGARYLKLLQRRFGNDLPLVLAGYNAGPGAVSRYGGVPPYRETRHYVRRVIADYAARQRQQAGQRL